MNFNIPYDFLLKEPIATEKEYISIHNKIKNLSYENINYFENKLGYSINKEWLNNLALHTQVVIKKSSINYQHGRVLYSCLRDYLLNHNNIQILETGTSKGFSAICMSKALKDSQKDGVIFTIDIIPHDKAMYWNGISDSYGKITRKNLLKPWADYTQNINFLHGRTNKIINHIIKKNFLKRINFAFLDAAHNLSAVRKVSGIYNCF